MTTDEQWQRAQERRKLMKLPPADDDYEEDIIIAGDGTKQPCEHKEAVKWNPYNEVVQCHRCGQIFIPKP